MTSRRIIIKVIIILLVFGVAGVVSAQSTTDTAIHNVDITVNQVAKIGLNDATALALSITDPTGAGGNNPDGDTGQRKLQYTNVVLSAATRRITIESDIGVPAGTNLGANISAITGTSPGAYVGHDVPGQVVKAGTSQRRYPLPDAIG